MLFHSVTCYTNSLVSHIHVSTPNLRNITCTLVATDVILQSLECIGWGRATFAPQPHFLNIRVGVLKLELVSTSVAACILGFCKNTLIEICNYTCEIELQKLQKLQFFDDKACTVQT
jgi:hypothetical protein